MVKRCLLSSLVALLVAPLWATAAGAGGSWLSPVQDDIKPGDLVTFVGYVGPGELGWVEDGPFYAYLRVEPITESELMAAGYPYIHENDVRLGQLDVVERGELGYLSLRISITFEIPADLAPNEYQLVYCNDPCTEGIGDLIGAVVFVGVDGAFPGCREWAFDEPEIANLSPDAEVCGVNVSVSAAAILSGEATMDPSGVVSVSSGPTSAATTPATPSPAGPGTSDQDRDARPGEEIVADLRNEELQQRSLDNFAAVTIDSPDDPIPVWALAGVALGTIILATVTVLVVRSRSADGG
ncbi:MAG: hypothetical protein OEP52_06690 [Acidimicrobiia bacterium]|nr:hypothetical protein [Acidimicrobiia bacterium]